MAREDYITARSYLERAVKALNEIAVRRTGENGDYTQDWVFDIVKEIGDLDRMESERTLYADDFEKAFETIKSSVLEADRIEMEKFIKNYGEKI